MPTYQYVCKNCGNEIEEFQSITEAPLLHCPKCNTDSLTRIIGTGSGLIFKGTGFYLTDYKKESGSPVVSKKKPAEKKSETKPATPPPEKKDSKE